MKKVICILVAVLGLVCVAQASSSWLLYDDFSSGSLSSGRWWVPPTVGYFEPDFSDGKLVFESESVGDELSSYAVVSQSGVRGIRATLRVNNSSDSENGGVEIVGVNAASGYEYQCQFKLECWGDSLTLSAAVQENPDNVSRIEIVSASFSTDYDLSIVVGDDNYARFYLNGELFATSSQLTKDITDFGVGSWNVEPGTVSASADNIYVTESGAVLDDPICSVLDENLDFAWTADQKQLIVSNTGEGSLDCSLSVIEGGAYFSIDRASLAVVNGNPQAVVVSCDHSALDYGQSVLGHIKLDTNAGTYYIDLSASKPELNMPEKIYSNGKCDVYKIWGPLEGVPSGFGESLAEWALQDVGVWAIVSKLGVSNIAGGLLSAMSLISELDYWVRVVPIMPDEDALESGEIACGAGIETQIHLDFRRGAHHVDLSLEVVAKGITTVEDRELLSTVEMIQFEEGYYYIVCPTMIWTEEWAQYATLQWSMKNVAYMTITAKMGLIGRDSIGCRLLHPDDAPSEVSVAADEDDGTSVSGPFSTSTLMEHSLLLKAATMYRFVVDEIFGNASYRIRYGTGSALAAAEPLAGAESVEMAESVVFEVQPVDGVIEFRAPKTGAYILEVIPQGGSPVTYYVSCSAERNMAMPWLNLLLE